MDSSSESENQDFEQEELEQRESKEEIEIAEPDSTQTYQIQPRLEEKFKPLLAKEVIHNVLFDHLSAKAYDQEKAARWCTDIADTIRDKIKKLDFKKYKFAVNVVLGTRNGAGVKMGTRCIWDAECDNYAHDSFTNETIFCVATVYAAYHY